MEYENQSPDSTMEIVEVEQTVDSEVEWLTKNLVLWKDFARDQVAAREELRDSHLKMRVKLLRRIEETRNLLNNQNKLLLVTQSSTQKAMEKFASLLRQREELQNQIAAELEFRTPSEIMTSDEIDSLRQRVSTLKTELSRIKKIHQCPEPANSEQYHPSKSSIS